MMALRSGISSQLEAYAAYRKACGAWSELSDEPLGRFDRWCADTHPLEKSLTQEMIDEWCERLPVETSRSCARRTLFARSFAAYACARGLADVRVPPPPKDDGGGMRVPHAFTQDELERFFAACDGMEPYLNRPACVLRKLKCCAIFRLLYSSGIRTTEARLLRREDVDLDHGVLDIRRSKGRDQHYVALHPMMAEVLRAYDATAERLQPGREWFFESSRGGPHCRHWLEGCFKEIWTSANGPADVVAYDLRHNYAVENIFSWGDDSCFEADDRLHWLSRSMGHRSVTSTLYYYSIVPRLSDKMRRLTEARFNEIVPEVWDGQEEL